VTARRPEDLLEPVDLMRHLRKLELSLGQVCQLAGITKTQLDYWTTRARIPTKGRVQRLYTLEALETVLLIKQGKGKGLSLQAAIEAAHRFKAAKAPSVPRRN
jgi:DNA-binding transcriptional MerR regulator